MPFGRLRPIASAFRLRAQGTGETSLLSPGLVDDIGPQASPAGDWPGMRRKLLFLGTFLAHAVQAVASDWGMGDASSRIAPPSMLRPVSTPAHEISTLAIFVLGVTTAIFVIVSGLLTYSVIRFRSRRPDDGSEPPQIYGSGPVEFAWTAMPVLIVFVLILVTARSIYSVQAVRRPPHALAVRVVGHQWWWEFEYPDLGVVTANELHVPVNDPRDPTPTFLELESADVAQSFWVPRLAGKTDLIRNKTNVTARGLPLRLREVPRLGGLGPLDDQVAAGAIMWSPAR